MSVSITITSTKTNMNATAQYQSEEEMYRFIECLSGCAGVPIHDEAHYRWIRAAPARIPNVVFDVNFDEDAIEDGLSEAKRRMERGEIPQSWIVTPQSRPAGLARYLEANGFDCHIEWSGMALNLDKVLDEPAPKGSEVWLLENDARLEEWTAVAMLNLFGGTLENVPAQAEIYRKVLGSGRMLFYAASMKDEIVATAQLFIDGDVAGIHAVATHADFRNRGIGRAVTLGPLLEARRRGARLAVLQASPLGEALYRKMGFEEQCRMAVYRYGV